MGKKRGKSCTIAWFTSFFFTCTIINKNKAMPGLGNISLSKLNLLNATFSFDESICGMLFDYGLYSSPFDDHVQLESYFGNNQVQLVRNLEEMEDMGLDEGFMNGVPYYHIKQFYDYIGTDADLYVMFANCLNGDLPDFEAIQIIQQASNGKIFQLGIWTEQCIWKSGYGNYDFTNLLGEIESQAEILSGRVNKTAADGLPLSVVLNACTAKLDDVDRNVIDHTSLPDATTLNFPKISVILGQNGTDAVHAMQKTNHNYTPVGFMGLALACLHLASAEMNIGYVDKFDLNKNDNLTNPELGFGSMVEDEYTPLDDLNVVRRNVISIKGYILPTTYRAKEAGIYFSNDQTLSEKDFASISLNRIAHKCRRIIRSVMFPYVNGNIEIDPSTGGMSGIDQAKITNLITERLDANMVNPLGQQQISGRYITFDNTQNILETDELNVNCYFIPVGSNMTIDIQEAYILNE